MPRRLLIAVALGLVALSPAWAIEKGQWEAGFGGAFYFFDNGMGLDNDLGPAVRLGWQLHEKMELELAFQTAETPDDFGGAEAITADYRTAVLDLIWAIGSQEFQPFLIVGIGAVELDLQSAPGRCDPETGFVERCLPRHLAGIDIGAVTEGRVTQADDTGFLWQAGLGARWPVSRRLGFRVQVLATRVDVFETSHTNVSAGVDLSVVWGQPK